ncbi:MAG: UDP-N-acetylglucosamine--N-acetylmuramyl-(pentapeptide) pyrophosphoryl-undecaprenol N-acetylglucosamine transferase [Kiritimatiellae bacterium]|jgi:UDP-N-acetylglucosamine--N-acetylmuramyl-(pentapeptide) pyrophosphoryl-undecaprenol N-acetylglucosamine transferase|nr:UDP-N-acetylglucosamine--N-acetylmuramyl-(pentapeptide) pyrophosphoryl-undecaprenol N-acetylglucosamine transferase [Kiritimatiellia bacterium]
MIEQKRCFVVACGGTGGHIFPGLAVAKELKKRGHRVAVWLSGRDIETEAIKGWDGEVLSTGARQLSIKSIPYIIRAFFRCVRGLNRLKPDALLAMGSYSSLPPVLAAQLAKVPVFLHEANSVPGKAVDFLSRFAVCTATSFRETGEWLTEREVCCTGLPVRSDLAGQPKFDEIPDDAFVIFVTGGSQGARRLNQLISQAFVLLKKDNKEKFFVIHQSGKADKEALKALYEKEGIPAMVSAFIPEMGRAYASADFVVARAGASTCFELSSLGKPALLVPLPSAVRNHQHLNASSLVKSGGADEGVQSELTPRSLMRYLDNKMRNRNALAHMSQAIKVLAVENAAELVADEIEKR